MYVYIYIYIYIHTYIYIYYIYCIYIYIYTHISNKKYIISLSLLQNAHYNLRVRIGHKLQKREKMTEIFLIR